jgi:hypothetical protein
VLLLLELLLWAKLLLVLLLSVLLLLARLSARQWTALQRLNNSAQQGHKCYDKPNCNMHIASCSAHPPTLMMQGDTLLTTVMHVAARHSQQ